MTTGTRSTDIDTLALDNQLCFPLYTAAREVTARYTPFLKELGLTYTQYICMMVMWEAESLSVKDIGARLHLDSGTLTPLLKKLEAKGLVTRERDRSDERKVKVTITQDGRALRSKAQAIPQHMGACVDLSPEESLQLKTLLNKVMASIKDSWKAKR